MLFLKEFFIIFSSISMMTCSTFRSENDAKLLSIALDEIVKSEFVGKQRYLDFYVIVCDKNLKNFALNVAENVIKMNLKHFISKIHSSISDRRRKKDISLVNSAFFFVEKFSEISELNNRIQMTNVDYLKFQHYVIILDFKPLDKFEKPKFDYDHLINYEAFIFKGQKAIKMASFVSFYSSTCKSNLKIINEFSMKTQKWKNQELGLPEYTNFNGCPLKVPLFHIRKTFTSFVLYELFEILSSKLNVKIVKTKIDNEIYEEYGEEIPIVHNQDILLFIL